MDEKKASLMRPKLEALKAFLQNVTYFHLHLPDNETRANYREMYADIAASLEDPKLELYAPPLPHLGTTGPDSTLWAAHRTLILDSASRLVTYLEAQLAQVPSATPPPSKRMKCFLSHRVSGEGSRYTGDVKRFLEYLGIEVVSGDKFEPRSVREKVAELLAAGHDFGVLIVAEGGESFWTRDEVNALWSEGKYVIVLVEEGAEFVQALRGDLEWIPFAKGHLGDAFLKVLEGIEFIWQRRLT